MKKKVLLVLGLLALIMYCGAYLYVRQQHWIIHRSGFAFGMTDNHRVEMGDPGLILSKPHPWGIAHDVFTPLRWIETGYWYMRYPKGKPWPYF